MGEACFKTVKELVSFWRRCPALNILVGRKKTTSAFTDLLKWKVCGLSLSGFWNILYHLLQVEIFISLERLEGERAIRASFFNHAESDDRLPRSYVQNPGNPQLRWFQLAK